MLNLTSRILCADGIAVDAANLVALYSIASALGQRRALMAAIRYLCGIVILLELDKGSLDDRICDSALRSLSDVTRDCLSRLWTIYHDG
jgi:hypothetical protein